MNAPTAETITNANSQVKILTKQQEKAERDLSGIQRHLYDV